MQKKGDCAKKRGIVQKKGDCAKKRGLCKKRGIVQKKGDCAKKRGIVISRSTSNPMIKKFSIKVITDVFKKMSGSPSCCKMKSALSSCNCGVSHCCCMSRNTTLGTVRSAKKMAHKLLTQKQHKTYLL